MDRPPRTRARGLLGRAGHCHQWLERWWIGRVRAGITGSRTVAVRMRAMSRNHEQIVGQWSHSGRINSLVGSSTTRSRPISGINHDPPTQHVAIQKVKRVSATFPTTDVSWDAYPCCHTGPRYECADEKVKEKSRATQSDLFRSLRCRQEGARESASVRRRRPRNGH